MSGAKEQLGHLLVLVAERQWTPLARALSELILSWPEDYPHSMRTPMEALLETALREADDATQADLAPRFAGRSDVPLKLLNLLYLAAPAAMRREILMRNELEGVPPVGLLSADGVAILAAARHGARDFLSAFAIGAGVPRRIAQAVLSDASGEALAVLCRGAGLDRATFSAIALLKGPRDLPLGVFDSVAPKAAAQMVQEWRKTSTAPMHSHIAAAE